MAARYDAFEAFPKEFNNQPDLFFNSSPDYTPRNGSLRMNTRPIGDMTGNSSFCDRSKRLLDVENEKNQLIEVGNGLSSPPPSTEGQRD
jgi:hypothetical protein